MRHMASKRTTYLILHSLVDSFFLSCPRVPFLSDAPTHYKLFQRYLAWKQESGLSRTRPHWHETVLDSLFLRHSGKVRKEFLHALPLSGSLALLAGLLRFYIHHHSSDVSLQHYLAAHSYYSPEIRESYKRLSHEDNLPSFSRVYQQLAPAQVAAYFLQENQISPPLLFSNRSVLVKAYPSTPDPHPRNALTI